MRSWARVNRYRGAEVDEGWRKSFLKALTFSAQLYQGCLNSLLAVFILGLLKTHPLSFASWCQ